KMGKAPATAINHSVVEVRCACIPCNGGGGRGVEWGKKPIKGRVMGKTTTQLEGTQKKNPPPRAVVEKKGLHRGNAKNRGHFFTRNECEALRLHRRIPDKTVVQIGAYMRSGYSADGTIVWLDFPNASKAARASVSTFVIGYLVVQVVTVHHASEHE